MNNVVNIAEMQTQEVQIDGYTIKQDADGRYCLNDVHKASGGGAIKAPAQWMRHDPFKELEQSIMLKSTIKPTAAKAGRYGGTYAVKELVYAYAMWISPEYHLKVIRAYDRMVTDGVAVHENAAADLLNNPLKYIKALMSQAEKLLEENEALNAQIIEDAPLQKSTIDRGRSYKAL